MFACGGLCHDTSDASSRVLLCLNTGNLVSEEHIMKFNKALLASRLDNRHTPENTEKTHTSKASERHPSGQHHFWPTGGSSKTPRYSGELCPQTGVRFGFGLVDDGGRETSSSFNPLPWLQLYTYRENNKHLVALKIDIRHPF